jgi:Amt family ammonium transporter
MVIPRILGTLAVATVLAAGPASAWGQDPASLEKRVADLEAKAAAPVNSGDNAWMLVSCALVLMMTGPGLALFYGGLVRRKNVLSTMMHSMFLMGLMSLLWFLYGYSVAFADGNALFGNPATFFMMRGVSASEPNATYAATIPHQTFMLFQLMFAIITPALISGAYAERIKFGAMVLFTILWATVVYFPLAHMVWGNGGLFNWALGGKIPALDFAGGTVVHISSGVSALVCAVVVGKRLGYPGQPMPPHNVVYSMVGAALLWVGWFGFNAGSALSAGSGATSAFAATHFAAAAAAVSWAGTEWVLRGKPSALGAASGMVAGLVAVTPAAGFVSIPAAVAIGLVAGVACYLAAAKLKYALGYDDSLDAFGVHGVGGTLGALLTGLLASKEVNPALFKEEAGTVVYDYSGGAGQCFNQLLAAGITWVWAAVASFVLLKIIDALVGLRPTEAEENQGLDLTLHGEAAYN